MAVTTAAVVTAGAAVGGAVSQRKAAKRAAKEQRRAAEAGIGEQREAREAFEQRTEPFRQLGITGAEQLQAFLEDPSQAITENPFAEFLREQGFEQIQESAAARGRLGAGGTLADLTRFNVGLGGQLQQQRFNQLFNLAGLGANVAAGQGTAGLQTATNVSNLLGNIGAAQAAGAIGQSQAITGGLQNLAGVVGAFPGVFGGAPAATPISAPIAPTPAATARAFDVVASGGTVPTATAFDTF